jgi:formate hydrogenlyase subunit 4
VDDPTTHLELTMIHEAMILDHSGPDLAFLEYAACLKLWVLGTLAAAVAFPTADSFWLRILLTVAGAASAAFLTGVVESSLARLRMPRVPQFLLGAAGLSLLALFLLVWR